MLWTILLILLLFALLGALPTWPYSADWGYYASSGLALVLVVLNSGDVCWAGETNISRVAVGGPLDTLQRE